MNNHPASTAPLAAGLPLVQGRCPACGSASLFLGDGSYVTCSRIDCPEPDAASTLLEHVPGHARALASTFDGLERLLATSSRDWQTDPVDAWLWAVLVGWDCEETEHTDSCVHGALEETAAMHGWDEQAVAKARRYREALRALLSGQAPPPLPCTCTFAEPCPTCPPIDAPGSAS